MFLWAKLQKLKLNQWAHTHRHRHQRGPHFPFKAAVSFPSEQTLKTDSNLISDLSSPPIKGPNGQCQCGRVQTHHIFKDQSQGFLGVDDVMEEHDVGMLQAFQKRCCRQRTEQGETENWWEAHIEIPVPMIYSMRSLAASLQCNTGPVQASLYPED